MAKAKKKATRAGRGKVAAMQRVVDAARRFRDARKGVESAARVKVGHYVMHGDGAGAMFELFDALAALDAEGKEVQRAE